MMILMNPRKKLQQGFAVVPVIILVALVGLMVPTVKYVTDPEVSFDTRGFAQVMIDGVIGAIPKKPKQKPVVKQDPVTIEDIKEAKEEREEEEEAPPPPVVVQEPAVVVEEKPSQLEELIGMLDQQAQDSIEQEQAGVTPPEEIDPVPPQTEVEEEEPDIGELDDELFSMLDQQAQESIIKEVEEEKQAETYEGLANSGYLLEDDKAQYEKENEEPVSADASRWQGIADNIDEIEDKQEEIARQQESQTIIQQTSPDVTLEGQVSLAEALQLQRQREEQESKEETRNTELATAAFLQDNGVLDQVQADWNYIFNSSDSTVGQRAWAAADMLTFGALTNYGQTYNEVNQEMTDESYLERAFSQKGLQASTRLGTTVVGEIGGGALALTAVTAGLPVSTTIPAIWQTAGTTVSSTGLLGTAQTIANIPAAVASYGSATLTTTLASAPAWVPGVLATAGELATYTGLGYTTALAYNCEQGNQEACGLVADAAFGLDYGIQQAIAAMPPGKVNNSPDVFSKTVRTAGGKGVDPIRFDEVYDGGGIDEFEALQRLYEATPDNVARPVELRFNNQGDVIGFDAEFIQGESLLDLGRAGKLDEGVIGKVEEIVSIWQQHGLAHGDIGTKNIILSPERGPVFIDPVGYGDNLPAEALLYDLDSLAEFKATVETLIERFGK